MNRHDVIKKGIETAKLLQKKPEKEQELKIITNDDTYYLLLGYIVDALLQENSKGYHKKVSESEINSILNAKTSEGVRKELLRLFKETRQSRFRGSYLGIILAEIIEYEPSREIGPDEQQLIVSGFWYF